METSRFTVTSKGFSERSARKMMFVIIYDSRSVILYHTVAAGQTVTAQCYLKVRVGKKSLRN